MFTLRHPILSSVALALALGLPSAAHAGEITNVSLDVWAPGSIVTLSGSGFDGGGKPKVFGVREGEKKKIATKVTSFSDTSITLEVKAIPNSKNDPADGKTWDILVQPKGKQAGEDVTAAAAVVTEAPTVVEVSVKSATPGGEVEIRVANLGTKGKPKITIGGKKAAVKSVTAEESGFLADAGPISTILALIPKSLGSGLYDLLLLNKVGQTTVDDTVSVTGSSKKLGSPNITFTANGKKVAIKGKTLSNWTFGGGLSGQVTGTTGSNPTKGLTIGGITFNPNTMQAPMSFHGLPNDIATLIYSETSIKGGYSSTQWSGTGFDVTVTAVSGGQIGMDFSGTLSAPGKPNVTVEGSLIADIDFQ